MVLSRLLVACLACLACACPAKAEPAAAARKKSDTLAHPPAAPTTARSPATPVPLPVPRPQPRTAPAPAAPVPVPAPPVAPPFANTAPSTTQSIGEVTPSNEGTPLEKRERVRVCGSQWMEMKRNGTATGRTWRDFAADCFARAP